MIAQNSFSLFGSRARMSSNAIRPSSKVSLHEPIDDRHHAIFPGFVWRTRHQYTV